MARFWHGYCLAIVVASSAMANEDSVTLRPEYGSRASHPAVDPRTTFERLLPLAEAGDPDIQNVLGFMFFYAEGVPLDYDQSHDWFHLAADQGNALAQRNLGLFHSQAWERVPRRFHDPVEANFWFSLSAASAPGRASLASRSYPMFLRTASGASEVQPIPPDESGQQVYVTFCAGCHGFEGHAPYPEAPSLLLGERLERSDELLVTTVLEGRGNMPAWRGTLTPAQAKQVVSFIREQSIRTLGQASAEGAFEPGLESGHGERAEPGAEYFYVRFCAGCHGFNGISYYVNSPSFALGERMHKSDLELAASIGNGLGIMPGWERILGTERIEQLVTFIRGLAPAYESGIDHDLRLAPDLYFLFTPKGENGLDWHERGAGVR